MVFEGRIVLIKALSPYGADLIVNEDPHVANFHFRELCVKPAKGGPLPWTNMQKDLRILIKFAVRYVDL
jgi:hypothetical protein